MVATARRMTIGPIAFRYPRAMGVGVEMPNGERAGRSARAVIREGGPCVLSFGTRLKEVLDAAEALERLSRDRPYRGRARFAKPLEPPT